MGVGGQSLAPIALPPANPLPITQDAGDPRAALERCKKVLPPPWFDPPTVQPVVSLYTDWATPAHKFVGELALMLVVEEANPLPVLDPTHQTTRRHTPEDQNLDIHRR